MRNLTGNETTTRWPCEIPSPSRYATRPAVRDAGDAVASAHANDARRRVGETHTLHVQPTQFTFLQLDTPGGVDVRPMSLATSPTRPHVEYGVGLSDSTFKRAFAALQPGEPATRS